MRITSEEGKKRLLEVKEQILAMPQLFDMSDFEISKDCETVCCICGWLNFNAAYDKKYVDYCSTLNGCRLLGLDRGEFGSTRLFYDSDWPEPFRTQYEKVSEDPEKRAHVAAEFIDYLVEGGEF